MSRNRNSAGKRKAALAAAAAFAAAAFAAGPSAMQAQAYENYLFATEFTASSQLWEEGYDHSPSNLQDYSMSSCWTEGAPGVGTGESVQLFIPAGTVVTGARIWNGFLKSEKLFYENNAPSSLVFSTGGQSFTVDLSLTANSFTDAQNGYSVWFPAPLISDGVVSVRIDGVRKGSKYDDTCISELYLFDDGTSAGIGGIADDGLAPDETGYSGGVTFSAGGLLDDGREPGEETETGSSAAADGYAASGETGFGHGIDPDITHTAYFTPSQEDIARLASMGAMLCKYRTNYAPAQEMDFSAEDLSAKDRAYLLFLYAYLWHDQDSRIVSTSSGGTDYNLVTRSDLQDILAEIAGSADEAALNALAADTQLVPQRTGENYYLSTLDNAGSFAGHYYEMPYSYDVEENTLILYGTVQQYDEASKEYAAGHPYIMWYEKNAGGDNYRFVRAKVGAG